MPLCWNAAAKQRHLLDDDDDDDDEAVASSAASPTIIAAAAVLAILPLLVIARQLRDVLVGMLAFPSGMLGCLAVCRLDRPFSRLALLLLLLLL